jgi:hypothetical protein
MIDSDKPEHAHPAYLARFVLVGRVVWGFEGLDPRRQLNGRG